MIALFLLAVHAAIPVWIDTDPSVARGGHEIDDGFALVQAFRSKELAIRGVSVVFGNAPLEQAWPIGQEIVRRFGPPGLPIHKGAAKAGFEETGASRALADALRKEKLTILLLGPGTNIATVLKLHPELGSRMRQLIAVAGRRPGQRFTAGPSSKALRDFNFEMDPEAFDVILKSGVPLVLAPWEISSKVRMLKADLDGLRSRSPAIEWLYEPAMDWLALWKREFNADGFNPFDTLAVGYLTARKGFTCKVEPVQIETLPDDTGAGGQKPYLLAGPDVSSISKVTYCSDAGPGFKAHLLSRLH